MSIVENSRLTAIARSNYNFTHRWPILSLPFGQAIKLITLPGYIWLAADTHCFINIVTLSGWDFLRTYQNAALSTSPTDLVTLAPLSRLPTENEYGIIQLANQEWWPFSKTWQKLKRKEFLVPKSPKSSLVWCLRKTKYVQPNFDRLFSNSVTASTNCTFWLHKIVFLLIMHYMVWA